VARVGFDLFPGSTGSKEMMRSIAAVTGGSNGLGRAILARLLGNYDFVVNFDLNAPEQLFEGELWISSDVGSHSDCRLAVEEAVEKLEREIVDDEFQFEVLVNNAGVNDINFFEDIEPFLWDNVMGVNAMGIFNMSQALFLLLKDSQGTILNITSNAAWVPMTSSLVYNASKAAAHMMTIQMAHEFHRRSIPITVFGIAPGKIEGTPMSRYIEGRVVETRGWTPEFAKEYQLNSLKSGNETSPEQLANFIGFLLSGPEHHRQLAGCILPYGA